MTFADLENALRTWAKGASGLDDAHVIWAEQSGARPTSAFITLKLLGLRQVGAVDEVVTDYDTGRPGGFEIRQQVRSLRELTLSVQVFTPGVTGAASSFALAQTVQSALYLPSVRALLAAVYLSPFDPGTVQSLNTLVDTRFEARALFEVRCYAMLTAEEFTTWIEHCTPAGTYA